MQLGEVDPAFCAGDYTGCFKCANRGRRSIKKNPVDPVARAVSRSDRIDGKGLVRTTVGFENWISAPVKLPGLAIVDTKFIGTCQCAFSHSCSHREEGILIGYYAK